VRARVVHRFGRGAEEGKGEPDPRHAPLQLPDTQPNEKKKKKKKREEAEGASKRKDLKKDRELLKDL
jgi:hypothetical protein